MLQIEIAAERLFSFLGFPVTNTLVTAWVAAAVLAAVALVIAKGVKLIPAPVQNVFEILVEGLLGIMASLFGSRERAEQYLPLIATLFVFILASNWLGIFPGVGSIGFYETHDGKEVFIPLFRSAASDLNLTIVLAVAAVLFANVSGARALGVGTHLKKFFSFANPINFFVGILELISEFAKIISFSMRLFGNIFAGEVLLVITSFLAPFGAPIPFLMLEVFVGFVQALVFAMLTMVFTSIAVAEHH
ncbi:MAG: F0F1 ATP synthase subunit A [bacterium]|nr:F0F1 ATP synthase subunit A [bacterium]MDZ4296666.1 F0F1 ATP synthase subunit A [Patescibacteria group bacterium]